MTENGASVEINQQVKPGSSCVAIKTECLEGSKDARYLFNELHRKCRCRSHEVCSGMFGKDRCLWNTDTGVCFGRPDWEPNKTVIGIVVAVIVILVAAMFGYECWEYRKYCKLIQLLQSEESFEMTAIQVGTASLCYLSTTTRGVCGCCRGHRVCKLLLEPTELL